MCAAPCPYHEGVPKLVVRVLVVVVVFAVGLGVGWVAGGYQHTHLGPKDRVYPAPVGTDVGVGIEVVWRAQVDPSDRVVALTFDDGPEVTGTGQVLSVLAAHEATATFFMLGEAAQAHPQVVRDVLDAGGEVGLHGWSHTNFTLDSAATINTNLDRGAAALRAAGADPQVFRPPYGRIDSLGLGAAAARGYALVLWSDRLDGRTNVPLMAARLRPGAVVLCHDGRGTVTPEVLQRLDELLTALDAAGYQYVTVSQLLAAGS